MVESELEIAGAGELEVDLLILWLWLWLSLWLWLWFLSCLRLSLWLLWSGLISFGESAAGVVELELPVELEILPSG